MAKRKLNATTCPSRQEGPRHHFYVSSAAEWRVGYDLGELIAAMQKQGYPFNVWLVPLPKDEGYEIKFYAPQVDGAVWLSSYLSE